MSTAAQPAPTQSHVSRSRSIDEETYGQIQSLAQRIQTMLGDDTRKGHAVGVTSCDRREGVSVVASNLAICASEVYAGKVLLIDANPRHASVAARFGVRPSPGLADCLSGTTAANECIVSTGQSNLFVLPHGGGSHRHAVGSESQAAALFQKLRNEFDLIVMDLPPAGEMDEMLPASMIADGFLLVLEAERIRRQAAQRVKRQFEQVNGRLLGAVFNKRKNHIPEWLYRRL